MGLGSAGLGQTWYLFKMLASLTSVPQFLSVDQGAGGGEILRPSSTCLGAACEDVACMCVCLCMCACMWTYGVKRSLPKTKQR